MERVGERAGSRAWGRLGGRNHAVILPDSPHFTSSADQLVDEATGVEPRRRGVKSARVINDDYLTSFPDITIVFYGDGCFRRARKYRL